MPQFNPFSTTAPKGTFSVESEGYVQGLAMSDPSSRNYLAGGTFKVGDIDPVIFGGVAITETVNASNQLGSIVQMATSNITGFSVFDQAHSMVTWPGNAVPLAYPGQTVNFYRIGSNARIPVAMDPSLVALNGVDVNLPNNGVYWDFVLKKLVPAGAVGDIVISSSTVSYSNGVYTISVVTAAPTAVGGVGDYFVISGFVNPGTGGNALINGVFTASAFVDDQHFSFQVTAGAGEIAAPLTSGVVSEHAIALPTSIRVLDMKVSNCMVAEYQPSTDTYNWNPDGACALLLI